MKTSHLIKAAALAALLAGGSAMAAPATVDVIVNGGFEQTAQVAGTWDFYNSLPGWSYATNQIEVRNNVEGSAASGNNFVELDTSSNSQMSQLIHTNAGQTYTLTFQYQDRINVAADSQGLSVYWGAIPSASNSLAAVTSVGSGASGWTTVSTTLTGTGSDMYLTFAATGRSDGLGTSLDNVTLTTAVPEPETYAMLLAGLGLVGFAARRKAAKK